MRNKKFRGVECEFSFKNMDGIEKGTFDVYDGIPLEKVIQKKYQTKKAVEVRTWRVVYHGEIA